MKKFNSLFKIGTSVQVEGQYKYRKISKIHETRKWIEVKGLCGEFQRGHIFKFTNKK